MRLPTLICLILISGPLQVFAQETTKQPAQPTCRKNIVIYFDNSFSMSFPAKVGGGSIRDMMLEFFRQALLSPQFIKENDSLTVKSFVYKAHPIWSSKIGEPITAVRKAEVLSIVNNLQINRKESNDFVELAKDFEEVIRAAPKEADITTYLLVFSDFFYDPPGPGKEDKWAAQKRSLPPALERMTPLLEEKQARLILWYQKNEKGGGVDLFNLYEPFAGKVDDAADIPQLVKAVIDKFRLSLLLDVHQSRLLVGAEGLRSEMLLRNPNCSQVTLESLETNQVTAESKILAQPSQTKIEVSFAPAEARRISIPLRTSVPKEDLLGTRYLGHSYAMTIKTLENKQSNSRSARLLLEREEEKLAVAPAEAVLVRHILRQSRQLFLRLNIKGNLLQDANLEVALSAPGWKLVATEPKDGRYHLISSNLNQPHIFVFSASSQIPESAFSGDGSPSNLLLSWQTRPSKAGSDGPRHSDTQPVVIVKVKDYRSLEWVVLVIILALGITVRIHYARIGR